MPSSVPEKLRPFISFGIDLQFSEGDKEAIGVCPFCDREKFSVNIESGLYRCLVCAEGTERGGGNVTTFLRHFHDHCDKGTTDYSELEEMRGLNYSNTPMEWGMCKNFITGKWMVPAYGADGKLNQLYTQKQLRDPNSGEWNWKLLPTPTLSHQLFGVNLYSKSKRFVYLTEGPWDGAVLWETLGHVRTDESGDFKTTSNREKSFLGEASVLATPGCNVFQPSWIPLFSGKDVLICFDNDHPKKHPKTGKRIPPAGLSGVKRIAMTLASSKKPPKSISYLRWGELGYEPQLPSGTDIRDVINAQSQ